MRVETSITAGPLVRVLRAGVCDTDLQLISGYMGFDGVLGHEFVGVAEEGPFATQRVVGEINCNCQRCSTCLSVSVLPLISERFALSDGVGALDAAKRRGVLKVLIDVASS